MNTKFKRGQLVKILITPDTEFVEYHTEETEHEQTPIKKGMKGKINLILQNGKYHVEIFDENGETLAYAPFDEDFLEPVE